MTRRLLQPLCPRDGTALEARRWYDAEYGFCPTCDGIRIARAELAAVFRTGGAPPVSHPEVAPEFAEGTTLCSCPGQPLMVEPEEDGLRLDVCPGCGTFWFDAGEMQCLLAARRNPELPGAARSVLTGLADAGLTLGAILARLERGVGAFESALIERGPHGRRPYQPGAFETTLVKAGPHARRPFHPAEKEDDEEEPGRRRPPGPWRPPIPGRDS